MKYSKRKCFAILTAASLTAGMLCPAGTSVAYAAEKPAMARTITVSNAASSFPDGGAQSVSNVQETYSAGSLPGVNYGEQIPTLSMLSQKERQDAKRLYDALKTITAETKAFQVDMPGFFSAVLDHQPVPEDLAEVTAYLRKISQVALDAYMRDYPEVFWIDVTKSTWSYSYTYMLQNGKYSVEVNALSYNIVPLSQYAAHENYAKAVENAVNSFPVTGSSRYEKLKSIHDELCKRVVYREGAYAHQIYGSLVDGSSVCEGYAEAFKAICDKNGIPCVLVSGIGVNSSGHSENHMWDCVQMENGKWYGVDVTWDDGSQIFYDYFLSGSNTVATHFNGTTFAATHKPDPDFNRQGFASFVYPVLSSSAYDPSEKPLQPAGYGDVDGNGVIDASDALGVLQVVVGLKALNGDARIFADVDADGEITSGDALLILKRVVNLVDHFTAEDM